MTFVGAGLEAWGGVCWGAARLEGPGQGLRRGLEGPVRPSQTSLDGAEEVQRGKVGKKKMFCSVLGLAGAKQDHGDETVSGCFKIFSHLERSMMKIHHHNEEEEAAAVMSIGNISLLGAVY